MLLLKSAHNYLLSVQWLKVLILLATVSMPGFKKKSDVEKRHLPTLHLKAAKWKCPLMPHTVAKHWSYLACRNAIWWGRCMCVCVCRAWRRPVFIQTVLKWPAQRRRWGQWVSAYLPPQPRRFQDRAGTSRSEFQSPDTAYCPSALAGTHRYTLCLEVGRSPTTLTTVAHHDLRVWADSLKTCNIKMSFEKPTLFLPLSFF